MPGPPEIKGQGNVEGDLAHCQMFIHREYGPFVKFKLDEATLVISTTDASALKACSTIFDKPEPLFQFLEPLIGKFMFLPVPNTKKLRKFMSDKLSPALVQKKITELLRQLDQEIDGWLISNRETSGVVGIQERVKALCMRLTITLVCEKDFLESRNLAVAIHTALEELLALQYNKNYKDREKLDKVLNYVNDTVNGFIRERQNITLQGAEERVLLDDLIAEDQEESEISISNIVKGILIGSHHTIASSVSWTLYAIASYPEVAKKVYREIDALAAGKQLDLQDLSELKYLSSVIKERARMYPPGPYTARQADSDLEMGGYLVPKGTTIFYPIWAVHMNPEYWPEPEKFNPERFSGNHNRLAFLPFGFGARACPGMNISNVQVLLILSKILQRLRVEAVPHFRPVIRENFVLVSGNDIQLKISSRSKNRIISNDFIVYTAILAALACAIWNGDKRIIALVCVGLAASFTHKKNIYNANDRLTLFNPRQLLREPRRVLNDDFKRPEDAVNFGAGSRGRGQ